MTVENIIHELRLDIFAGADKVQRTVKGAYVSDLLSNVMGRAREGEIWITMQTHKNIVAVASLKDLAAILITDGGRPDADTIATAESEGIVIIGSSTGSFLTCGRLFQMMERDAVVQG